MTLTQVNHEIGIATPDKDCVVVAMLSPAAQEQVLSVLAQLTDKLGDTIWPMPAHALHITLCEIIQPKPYAQDKAELFKNLPHYEAVLSKVLALPPIKVRFNAIEASPQAVIIRGEDNGAFNDIRAQLVSRLPLPAETKQPPDIIHSSIARYAKGINLAEIQAAVANVSLDFTETITSFQLLSQSAPHLVSYTVAREYSLD